TRRPDHRIGRAVLRLVPAHEFGYHAAQIIDYAGSAVLAGAVTVDHVGDDEARAKALRAVREVLPAHALEDAIYAPREELRPARHQRAQGGAHRLFGEVRQWRHIALAQRITYLLEPLIPALLGHVVDHISHPQGAIPELGPQPANSALNGKQRFHCGGKAMPVIRGITRDE